MPSYIVLHDLSIPKPITRLLRSISSHPSARKLTGKPGRNCYQQIPRAPPALLVVVEAAAAPAEAAGRGAPLRTEVSAGF